MKVSEKRMQRRISRRHAVQFGTERTDNLGFIKNMSLEGLAISSKTIFRPSTNLVLRIPQAPDDIDLKGEVRWSSHHRAPKPLDPIMEMGVLLTERNESYLRFLERMIETFKEARDEPRFEKVFRVAFETPAELLDEYTHNISQGGMFVLTANPPALNSIVVVNLLMVDIMHVVRVEGRVVHITTPADAERSGLRPGMGIHFTRFFDGDEALFNDYITRLREQAYPA